jgi:hypothetical protein
MGFWWLVVWDFDGWLYGIIVVALWESTDIYRIPLESLRRKIELIRVHFMDEAEVLFFFHGNAAPLKKEQCSPFQT